MTQQYIVCSALHGTSVSFPRGIGNIRKEWGDGEQGSAVEVVSSYGMAIIITKFQKLSLPVKRGTNRKDNEGQSAWGEKPERVQGDTMKAAHRIMLRSRFCNLAEELVNLLSSLVIS